MAKKMRLPHFENRTDSRRLGRQTTKAKRLCSNECCKEPILKGVEIDTFEAVLVHPMHGKHYKKWSFCPECAATFVEVMYERLNMKTERMIAERSSLKQLSRERARSL